MKINKHISIKLVVSSLALIWSLSTFAQPGFQLIKKSVIGGTGGWDYLVVDSENRRLYVSHSSQVEVLNADTHEKIGIIDGLSGVHGIAIVPSAGFGITTNGRSNTITLFDIKTLKKLKEIEVGKNPDALLYDKFSDRVFIFNHSGGTASAIDVRTQTLVGTVDLAGEGVEAGVSNNKGTIYVNLEDNSEIVSFDAKTLVVKNRWKLTPGEEPTGLGIDLKKNRLFTACHNELMLVLDAEKGTVIAQVPIGKGVDGLIFDPEKRIAVTSNGEGSLTVVGESGDGYKVLETVKTEPGARTITLDPKTHHVFVSTAQYGERPAATTENPNPRPSVVAGTFMVLEFGAKK